MYTCNSIFEHLARIFTWLLFQPGPASNKVSEFDHWCAGAGHIFIYAAIRFPKIQLRRHVILTRRLKLLHVGVYHLNAFKVLIDCPSICPFLTKFEFAINFAHKSTPRFEAIARQMRHMAGLYFAYEHRSDFTLNRSRVQVSCESVIIYYTQTPERLLHIGRRRNTNLTSRFGRTRPSRSYKVYLAFNTSPDGASPMSSILVLRSTGKYPWEIRFCSSDWYTFVRTPGVLTIGGPGSGSLNTYTSYQISISISRTSFTTRSTNHSTLKRVSKICTATTHISHDSGLRRQDIDTSSSMILLIVSCSLIRHLASHFWQRIPSGFL